MKTLAEHPHPADGFAGMAVRGDTLTDKDNAGAAILEACKEVKGLEDVEIGSYKGFSMRLSFEGFKHCLTLKGAMSHKVELGQDARGNLTRIENALAQMPERLAATQAQLDNLHRQVEAAKAELGKPFPLEAELQTKSARLAELNALLDMDNRGGREQPAAETVAKSPRPSVLHKLKTPPVHGSGDRKKSQRMEER